MLGYNTNTACLANTAYQKEEVSLVYNNQRKLTFIKGGIYC